MIAGAISDYREAVTDISPGFQPLGQVTEEIALVRRFAFVFVLESWRAECWSVECGSTAPSPNCTGVAGS